MKDAFEQLREEIPCASPIKPVQLSAQSEFQFDCHPGLSCFNECCRNIDIQLTPYDIVRLKRHLGMDAPEFVARFTLPFEMDHHGMPGLKLATKPGTTECVFLGADGCTVYPDRPSACRYYALGHMSVRKAGEPRVEDIYFVVKEPHCKGHGEPVRRTVQEYRRSQGVDVYDEMNRQWRDIVIKKRTSGPTVGAPSPRSMQLFDMCSYDMDSFRAFIQSEGFRAIFDVREAQLQALLDDEDALLQFAFRFLKQVLFGEFSIPRRQEGIQRRIEARKPLWKQRKEEMAQRRREEMERLEYEAEQKFSARAAPASAANRNREA